MLGLLPLVLSRAQGRELERPLAIVMIGGLITSTLFALLALPTFDSLVETVTARWRARGQRRDMRRASAVIDARAPPSSAGRAVDRYCRDEGMTLRPV